MFKNLLLKCLTIMVIFIRGQSFQLTYGFPNVDQSSGLSDPGPFPQFPGIVCGAFTAEGLSNAPTASGRFSFSGWPIGAIAGSDELEQMSGNLSPFSFYRVTIFVNSGYTLTLQQLEFSVRRSSTGPRTYCVRSDRDHYNSNLSASTGTNAKLSVIPTNVFFWNYDSILTSSDQYGSQILCSPAHQQITDSVCFQIYAWNAESPGGSFSIDNVKFTGYLSSTASLGAESEWATEPLLRVFPNPCKTRELIVQHGSETHLSICDANGWEQALELRPRNASQSFVYLGNLSPGFYFLKRKQGERWCYTKILLE